MKSHSTASIKNKILFGLNARLYLVIPQTAADLILALKGKRNRAGEDIRTEK